MIKSYDELIRGLQEECQKFSTISVKKIAAAFKVAGRRAIYPFRQSTLQKLDKDINKIRVNLSSALDVLQLNNNKRIHNNTTRIKAVLDSIRASQISSNLRSWLNAPDTFIDHNVTCAKKYSGTGMWLIKSDKFSKWLTEENPIM